jgi:DNA-binding FadR family transcriptional regulator
MPRTRLSEQVVDELERLIFREYPAPGTRLPTEPELAQRFGVSRIVIREAVKILEDRGLVEARAGSGTTTRAPSMDRVKGALMRMFKDQPIPSRQEMERLLEVRETLEEAAAALAAERATPADLEAMADALSRMKKRGPAAAQADLDFHLALARATQNPFFEIVLEPLLSVLIQQIKLTASYAVGVELHRAIYEKVKARRPVQAREASRRLLQQTRADVVKVLKII